MGMPYSNLHGHVCGYIIHKKFLVSSKKRISDNKIIPHLQAHPLEAHVLEYGYSESGGATLDHRVPRAGPALKCLLSFPHKIEDLHKHIVSCHATMFLRK